MKASVPFWRSRNWRENVSVEVLVTRTARKLAASLKTTPKSIVVDDTDNPWLAEDGGKWRCSPVDRLDRSTPSVAEPTRQLLSSGDSDDSLLESEGTEWILGSTDGDRVEKVTSLPTSP